MTLFCKRLALDVVGRVWDCFLMFGEAFVYRVAVAILKVLEKKLITKPFDTAMKELALSAPLITEKQLFDAVAPIKLNSNLRARIDHTSR